MKRAISLLVCFVIFSSLIPANVFASDEVSVYLNGKLTELNNTPYIDDGIWMIPFKEVMEPLGVPVEWNDETNAYVGNLKGVEISVTPDSDKEVFDLINFEMDRLTVGVDGDVMVQLDFIDKIYGSTVTTSEKEIKINLTIPKDEEKGFVLDDYLATLPEPENVFDCEEFYTKEFDNQHLTTRVVTETDDERFDRALEIENYAQLFQYWDSQIAIQSKTDLEVGDICVISFYARSMKSADESAMGRFGFCHEVEKTWIKMFEGVDCYIGGDWKRFQAVYKITERIPAGMSGFKIRVGYFMQTLQIAGMEVKNYGKTYNESVYKPDTNNLVVDASEKSVYQQYGDSYYGQEADALWRDEAFKRIEKYRVRDINVNVTDENGNPVSGAKVSANMTRSEFAWGTMVEEWQLDWNGRTSNKFRDIVLKDFNAMSCGGVHKYVQHDMGAAALATNFARENNLYNRFHNIFWDHETFFYNRGYDTTETWNIDLNASEDEVFEIFAKHASRQIFNFGDTFDEIDVVNEPFAYEHFQSKYGRQFVADLFKLVKDISPDSILFMNDGLNGGLSEWRKADFIKKWTVDVQSLGGIIDGLGFESHFEWAPYPQMLYNQFESACETVEYASVTEYDFKAEDIADYDERIAYETEVFRDALIISYSFPKMVGFHMWGPADFNHWRGNAPLYDAKYNPKDSRKPWDELVLGEWFTQTGAVTDENGASKMRGHRGEYDITVEFGGKTAKTTVVVSENGENTVNAVVTKDGIVLDSSELVVNKYEVNPKINYASEANFTEEVAANMYKTLYKNYVNKVSTSDGKSVEFLKKDIIKGVGNEASNPNEFYTLKSGNTILANTSETFDEGVVKIRLLKKENRGDICKIEGRSGNGEWKTIGTIDNLTNEYLHFDFPVDQIRLSVVGNGQVFVHNIHVSRKEWVRCEKE